MKPFGSKIWVIPEGYIPAESTSSDHRFISHEAACVLNTSYEDAAIKITIFYSDRDPVGPYNFIIPARRSAHLRFNDFNDPEVIPRDTDYSSLIESNVPIVVQHTRLDSRRAEDSIFSTMAYAAA